MKKTKFSKPKGGKNKGKGSATPSQPAVSKGIFGVPLEGISQHDPVRGWELPTLIGDALQRIRVDIKQEGIFRLSGLSSVVNELRAAYDSGSDVDLSLHEVNDCCGLLKLFLREMPEPLFPFRFYKAFVSFEEGNKKRKETRKEPRKEKKRKEKKRKAKKYLNSSFVLKPDNFERDKEYIKILLSNLAGPRKPLFFELFRLLHEVSQESEHNLMGASNLAVVIGPTVLRVRFPFSFFLFPLSSLFSFFLERPSL